MDRKAYLEQKEAILYEKAYYAYWNSPTYIVEKIEAQLAQVQRELVALGDA